MIKTESSIRKLPDDVINKISAGEVINRPASVLKELIENSIDANSTSIEVYLEEGGKRVISVIDNGNGIAPDEITLAVDRHSTSKIFSFEDIYNLNSYGFRGEALHSISSVSKFSIVSRKRDYPLGKELYIEGGKIVYLTDTGSPIGTKVKVKDLFFNIPVRKKFLKSSSVEFKHSLDVFLKYSLMYPDIYFKLFKDSKLYINLEPSTLKDRLTDIFPKLKGKLLEISYQNDLGNVNGFIGLDESYKKSGYIFINKRPIKNKDIKKIVKGVIGEKFYVLFIELPNYFVDFNIHPTKEEVKFKKDEPVFQLIKNSLRNINNFCKKSNDKTDILKQEVATFKKDTINSKLEILGQIEDTFLVVYLDGDIYILDQHILSERINFELLYRKFLKGKDLKSKVLTKKHKINLSYTEAERLYTLLEDLKRLGFNFKIEGRDIYLTTIPNYLTLKKAKDILLEILNSEDTLLPIEKILGEIACSLSVKAGNILSNTEAKILLENWIKTDNPNLCPHGRPIYYKVSLNEVKRVLGRF